MRIRRALVVGLLAIGAQTLAVPGAHAAEPSDTLAEQWYSQAVSADSITVSLPIKGLRTGSTESCGLEFSYKVGYNKPRFSWHLHEYGEAKTSGGCNGFRKVQLTQNISDKGVPVFSSTYNAPSSDQSDFDSPYAYLRAYSEQSVPALTFPGDWHGFGSTINWIARVNITWKPGWTGDTNACLGAYATIPATPVFVPCT
jgi:hypothetical protein